LLLFLVHSELSPFYNANILHKNAIYLRNTFIYNNLRDSV